MSLLVKGWFGHAAVEKNRHGRFDEQWYRAPSRKASATDDILGTVEVDKWKRRYASHRG